MLLLSCQLPLLVVPILVAPHLHPMSSCLWQQLGVLSWWRFSGVIGIGVGMCYCCCHHSPSPPLPIAAAACCHPTHNPPCEQLLVRLGAGGVLFLVCHCHPLFVATSSSSSPPCHLCLPSFPLLFHPPLPSHHPLVHPCLSFQSPPHPLLIPQPSLVVVSPIPHAIHPTSSGS